MTHSDHFREAVSIYYGNVAQRILNMNALVKESKQDNRIKLKRKEDKLMSYASNYGDVKSKSHLRRNSFILQSQENRNKTKDNLKSNVNKYI